MRVWYIGLTVVCFVWFSLAACASLPTIASARNAGPLVAVEAIHNADDVARFYALHGAQPVWTGEANRQNLAQLLLAVYSSSRHGLTPEHYHYSILRAARSSQPDMNIDAFITDVYFTLAGHLNYGKVDPNTIESSWTFARPDFDAPSYLIAALEDRRVAQSLEDLAPQHEEYQRLREGLALYRGIEAEGGWSAISAGETLHPGDQSLRVAELRARLEATGDLPVVIEGRETFSSELETAVRRFQRREGLDSDGVVGAETLAQLNRSPADRIQQLRATLERWRWLPDDLGERHIRVNIAAYELSAWEGGERVQVHEAIVGRTYRRTPVFSAQMQYLILNPWWETPASIAVQDKLPLFRRDPGVIERLGYEIRDRQNQVMDPAAINWNEVSATNFPYRVRQRPGPQNALGRIKFMFPNQYNVYIHDTPSRNLFDEGRRDFSSGCIRIANPMELADWVLAGREDWPPDTVRKTADTGVETRIDLNRRIPVHILYFTVVVDEDVGFRFLNDIYDRDGAILTALEVPPGESETTE